jgi:DNA-binding NtrC family response regulator
MNGQKRILVIAQPELGRRLEQYLRAAGWSVYRSPDPSSIAETVRSVKPRILIVGLDAPWFDHDTLANLLAATTCETPVLALTDVAGQDGELATFLPASIEPQLLLIEMAKAIESDERCRREFGNPANTQVALDKQSGSNHGICDNR